jgi:sigma-E factor negative regulatory protein RseB
MIRPLARIGIALCFWFAAGAAQADGVVDWLGKINRAARTLNYDGTFVYLHGDQLEAVRIVHRVENGRVQERVISLNGSAREVVRTDQEVRCYLPDEKSVMVEHRRADDTNFPSLLPEQLSWLTANYEIELGPVGRVTGRAVQQIIIKPRDEYRYGYHLWADQETGLLLQADLRDASGDLIEQFMFAHVVIGASIPTAALEAATRDKGFTWHRDSNAGAMPATDSRWRAEGLPSGFRLSRHVVRQALRRNVPVEHLVLTDGLATVSVFIESIGESEAAGMLGASHVGAVHAFGARVGDHLVTAVGEVPVATVELIAGAVRQSP